MEKQAYTCEACGKGVELDNSPTMSPECCDQPMKAVDSLPVCEMSETAEHSRLADDSDPCDDGRAGQ